MSSSPKSAPKAPRFRVAEVVGVIAVLFVLAGLFFPTGGPSRKMAPKTQAKTDCVQIVAAVKAYYAEYGHYPLGTNANPENHEFIDFIYGQASTAPTIGSGVSNAELLGILRNTDSTGATPPGQANRYNPRGIVFFDAKTATDPVHPRSGFVPPDAKAPAHPGALVDPWGTEYFIAIDRDYNNRLTSLPYQDFTNFNAPYTGVGVFSLGKDQQLGTKGDGFYQKPGSAEHSDDIISWK